MIYFITEDYIKTYTPITANVDVNDVIPWVKTNAEMWIQPLLGTYFFDDLLTKYNDKNLNADEITLVGLIQPAIAWRAATDAGYGLSRQLKNKGLQTQSGDFSAVVDLTEVKFAMVHYRQKAEHYEAVVRKYLCDNTDKFPYFVSNLNTDSNVKHTCACCKHNKPSNMRLI